MEAGGDAGFPGGGFFGKGKMGLSVEQAAGDVDELGSVAGAGAQGIEIAPLGTEAGDEQGHVGDAGEGISRGIGEAKHEADLVAGLGHVGNDLEDVPVGARDALQFDVCRAGVGGDGEEIEAFVGVGQEGLDGVAAHEGIQRYGIRADVIKAGLGVVGLGLADVATFDIEHDGDV